MYTDSRIICTTPHFTAIYPYGTDSSLVSILFLKETGYFFRTNRSIFLELQINFFPLLYVSLLSIWSHIYSAIIANEINWLFIETKGQKCHLFVYVACKNLLSSIFTLQFKHHFSNRFRCLCEIAEASSFLMICHLILFVNMDIFAE